MNNITHNFFPVREVQHHTNKTTHLTAPTAANSLDLENLIDFILTKPIEQLPRPNIPISSSKDPYIFARQFIEQQLKPLCSRIAISGTLRRRELESNRTPILDFVVTPRGYDGSDTSLQQNGFIPFLQCYQLICTGGNTPIRRIFSPGTGLYYYTFVHVAGRIQIWLTPPERFGITLLLTSGPRNLLVALSLRARQLGHGILNAKGLYTASHQWIAAEETQIYQALKVKHTLPNPEIK